jgi:hypothetical protein
LEEVPVARFLAGAAACFLLMTGIFLIWKASAEEKSLLPPAPAAAATAPSMVRPAVLEAPEATPKSREEKRFARADRNDNGRIEMDDLLSPRRKSFAKLDKDGSGSLSFEEWAVRTIDKFEKADADQSKWLSPAEYATTAPKRRPKPKCRC